jgi:uncharacterized sulfatase
MRDIIWVTLESIRFDRTSMADHERDTTPFLQRFASEPGTTSFRNCVTHAIWTRPSTTSILTGRTPSNHRVWSTDAALPDDIPTIPERLRRRGYRTVGVSPNGQISPATGLDQGFDDFHYLGKHELLQEVGIWRLLRFLANLRRHSAGYTTTTRKHSIGYLNRSMVKKHLDAASQRDEPLFLYTHLADTHHPYYPPAGWQNVFSDDLDLPLDRALDASLDMADNLHDHIARGVPFDGTTWNAIDVLYDTCLRYVDTLVESIVTTARAELDDPIIVVTADHGEFFGEHGLLSHILETHTALTDVPLLIHGLDGLDDTDGDLVQHADVMQMLVNECGLDVDVPIGRDIRTTPREVAVTQRGDVRAQKNLDRLRELNPDFDTSRFKAGPVTSVRTHEYRYHRDSAGGELFELSDESTDVSAEHPAVRSRLDEQLDAWLTSFGEPQSQSSKRAEFSESTKRQLEDMGYL